MAGKSDPTFSVRFPSGLASRMDDAAAALGISRTAWLTLAAEEKLATAPPPPPSLLGSVPGGTEERS